MILQALPHDVERRQPTSAGEASASLGFVSAPVIYIPAGCPKEFAEMIADAIQGDTTRIERSYWEHPERRQRPELESRSRASSAEDFEDEDDDDDSDELDEMDRIEHLSLEDAQAEHGQVQSFMAGIYPAHPDYPGAMNKATRLKHRIADLQRSLPPTRLISFDKQIRQVTMDLVAPVWALEIQERAKQRVENEIAYRRMVLMNIVTEDVSSIRVGGDIL